MDSKRWTENLIKLLELASYRLDILATNLNDSSWYDNKVIRGLKDVSIHNQRSKIRFISPNSTQAAFGGHPFIELAQRLPSKIFARNTRPEDSAFIHTFIVADKKHIIIQNTKTNNSEVLHDSARLCLPYLEQFENHWEAGSPDLNFRTLT